MTDHKFTDEEVIKALECCDKGECHICPYDDHNKIGGLNIKVFDDKCKSHIVRDALDLINRQKAEIEEQDQAITKALKRIGEIRAEAYKEFAERLKQTAYTHSTITGYQYPVVDVSEIDNLVKEMTEEKKQ